MNSRWILTVQLLTILNSTNAKLLGLEKGSFCNGGRCEILNECSTVGDFRKNKPEICSFEGVIPIICCPLTALFTSTKQGPTSTIRAPTSTKQMPLTIRAPTSTKQVPSTIRAPTSTKQVPSTKRAPTSTKQVPSTIRAPTSTKQVPSTIRPTISTMQAYTSLTHTLRTPGSSTKPSYIIIPTSYNSSTSYQKPEENKFKLTYTKGVYGGIRYDEDTLAKEVHNESNKIVLINNSMFCLCNN